MLLAEMKTSKVEMITIFQNFQILFSFPSKFLDLRVLYTVYLGFVFFVSVIVACLLEVLEAFFMLYLFKRQDIWFIKFITDCLIQLSFP